MGVNVKLESNVVEEDSFGVDILVDLEDDE